MADEDREKALETALANIEKQFGKGAVMRLGDDAAQEVPAIPTGALTLDVALGIGGLPRGRVVELYGPEASGKCLTADTYIWTDHGLETVAELFERCGQAASCTSRVTDVADQGVRAVNERGDLETIAALTHNDRRPVRRVTVTSGRQVAVTHNHPLRVLNQRGRIVWRRAGKLQAGDVLVSAAFGAAESPGGGGDLSEDEAVLLGYLVAEGSLTSKAAVRFTNGDREVGEEFTAIIEGLFGCEVHCDEDEQYAVHSTALRQRLADEYGLDYVAAAGKTVPHRIRTAGHKLQRAFLSALFEGDGCDRPTTGSHRASGRRSRQSGGSIARIDGSSSVGLGTASEELARQVQLMLYGLGVPATVSSRSTREYERDYWRVTVNPACVHRFLDEAGFRSRRRADQVDGNFRRSGQDPQLENVPHLRESADHRLTFEEVTEIEEAGEKPTFDLVLPETHSFVTNGLVSHNTTVGLHILAEAQKQGGIAAFIDAEHALDPTYAKAIGLDTDELLVSQPDTGEQALEIMDMLIRSGAVDVIAVDSVAALTPKAEIEGEMGDSHVGLQARLMSQAMRKLAGSLKKSSTCALFINQIREKIGVMFGCMSYATRVTLADGTQEKIGKIVNQKMPVEVLSYDFDSGKFVSRKVVDWFDNGRTDEFLKFVVARGGGNGRSQFATTPNHQISTPHGWVAAGDLEVGDTVLQSVPHYLSDFQWEVVLGGLMGDGALSPTRSGHGARFRVGHGRSQADYADWKVSLFDNVNVTRWTNEDGAVFFDVQPLPELADLRDAVYWDGGKMLSYDYLKHVSPLSIAVWYQDDGSFQVRSQGKQTRSGEITGRAEICVEALEETSRQRLRDHLADTWGIEAKLCDKADNAFFVFPAAETAKLHELVAPYVHPSMDYKLLPRYRGRFDVTPDLGEVEMRPVPMPIVEITPKPPNGRQTHRYDIEVEGDHNYLVDGVMVHNSPETTPGGRALKFYSSVRLDIRRIETLKDGKDAVGNRCRVKVVKNKCAPPFRTAEFDIVYGEGISKEGTLLDLGVEEGLIRKAGAWYSYDDEQLGQGRENAREFLREHDDIALDLEKRVKDELGIAPLAAEGEEADEAEGEDTDDGEDE